MILLKITKMYKIYILRIGLIRELVECAPSELLCTNIIEHRFHGYKKDISAAEAILPLCGRNQLGILPTGDPTIVVKRYHKAIENSNCMSKYL